MTHCISHTSSQTYIELEQQRHGISVSDIFNNISDQIHDKHLLLAYLGIIYIIFSNKGDTHMRKGYPYKHKRYPFSNVVHIYAFRIGVSKSLKMTRILEIFILVHLHQENQYNSHYFYEHGVCV